MAELKFFTKDLEFSTCIEGGFAAINVKSQEIKVSSISLSNAFRGHTELGSNHARTNHACKAMDDGRGRTSTKHPPALLNQ